MPILTRTFAQDAIIVENVAGAATPITLSGYSGEASETLRFDLEVAGCRVVGDSEAQYTLTGGMNGGLEGRLATKAGSSLFGKVYTKGTLRQQAHALADDVIKALGGQGVARTRIAFKSELGAGHSEIYVADYDGHSAQAITSDNAIVAAPAWVPGRLAVLYTSYRLGNPDIFVHDLGSGSRRPFSRRAGLNTSAAISPDGS
ncbi:MAG: hypothetical protein IT580_00720, partial [Verrucomicrobiales bacterium]|nr:hypothetical protein [Verrucomicrobiales bacterium]